MCIAPIVLPIFHQFVLIFQDSRHPHLFTSHVDHYWEFDFRKGRTQKERVIPRKNEWLRNAGMAGRV